MTESSRWWFRLAFSALLTMASVPSWCQPATLVRDLRVSGSLTPASSSPNQFQVLGDKLLFIAGEPSTGGGLWATDGTSAGTELLAVGVSRILGRIGKVAFWSTGSGAELGRSDGTRAGTYSLTPPDSGVQALTSSALGFEAAFTSHRLFFLGCTLEDGCQPWSTDGTRAGTQLLKKLADQRLQVYQYIHFVAAGDKLFLFNKTLAGDTLWVSDGTAAGTVELKGLGTTGIDATAAVDGRVFFLAPGGNAGTEVWTSDGTVAGTRALTNLRFREPFLEFPELIAVGRRVYFVAADTQHGRQLWRSDGTPAGTQPITAFKNAEPFPAEQKTPVREVGDYAVFIATDGSGMPKLWSSRGGPSSVTPVFDPCHGSCDPFFASRVLATVGQRVVFFATDEAHGIEPWSTDGTAAGTQLLRDTCPGPCSYVAPSSIIELPGLVTFYGSSSSSSSQYWQTDGTPSGTRPIAQFSGDAPRDAARQAAKRGLAGRDIAYLPAAAIFDGALYFNWKDERGSELWRSRGGSPASLVADMARDEPSADPQDLTAFQDRLYFTADAGTGRSLWRSDG
ncbi:MAG TPA: hypothetical protein VGE98_13005, partial [Thermoanaerobaculia bacterium]